MLTHSDFQEVHFYSAGGVIALDQHGLIVYSNPKVVNDLFKGIEHIGQPIDRFFKALDPDADGLDIFLKRTLTDAEYIHRVSDKKKNVLISSSVFTGAGDTRTYLYIRDISPLKKKEKLYTFLNSATEQLSQARDTKTALEQISSLIISKFANWFSIDLLQSNGLEELVLAHEDPDLVKWARKYREAYPTDLQSSTGVARVLKTGKANFAPVITKEMVLASIQNPSQLEAVQHMNLQSVIIVPIINKAEVTGVITFVSTDTGNYYDEADLHFAESFATHISLALENARLNEEALREIGQRIKIERTLKLIQVQLKTALSSGLVGTWVFDIEKDLVYADENLSRMFGVDYNPLGLKQEIFSQMIHPDDQPLVKQQRQEAIIEGQIYETEYRVIVNGAIFWFFARGQIELTEAGRLFAGVIVDITQRKEAELALQENESKFSFLADAIPHKLWTSDAGGNATYYNQGWYDYTGISGFSELKATIWDLIHPEDRTAAEEEWPKAIERGEEMSMEQRIKRHDGQYRWHLSRFSAHRDKDGKIRLWVGTSTDIQEQKENEYRKDEFLSIASHELKTPLTTIKAFNQLMKRAKTPALLNDFIDKSAEHIYKLERLISDLLDVTKLNAGKLIYTMDTFSFDQMLAHTIQDLQYNTSHEIVIGSSAEIYYTGDHFRLEQVIDNLLTNAIKYSPDSKKIIVNSKIEQNSIIVSVQDFGIGIAPENVDRLFDRYYRVDNTAMRFEGLGLGLYISSEILKRHQGSFWIESELGVGSIFYFRLPLLTDKKERIPVQTADYYQDDHITISHNRVEERLDVSWTGFQDRTSVEAGCMLILDYMKRHHLTRIVNDNTYVQGNWSDAVEWVGNVWFPMMEKAGLKYFAHIFSPSTFSQLSAKKSIDIMAGIITTQYFTDQELAGKWMDGHR
jgi:PAS domain S-box-containing protein